MKHLTSLLPEALRQEVYALWDVRLCKHGTCCFLATCFISGMLCLLCRNMKLRAVQRHGWWNSLTSWRWSCRRTSMRSWREHQEDCRSSLTPQPVRLQHVYRSIYPFFYSLWSCWAVFRSFPPPGRSPAGQLCEQRARKSHDQHRWHKDVWAIAGCWFGAWTRPHNITHFLTVTRTQWTGLLS